jgi:hypothetical protein
MAGRQPYRKCKQADIHAILEIEYGMQPDTYSRDNGRQSYIQEMESDRFIYLTVLRKAGRHPHMHENDRQTSMHEKERQADIRT